MVLVFAVDGEPTGKGRPRFSRNGHAHTPEKTIIYENLVKVEFRRQCGCKRFADTDELRMEIIAYYGIPKSASKKRQQLMAERKVRPTKKPDMDNVLKAIADSLNGVAYKDDTQIVDASIRKFYSDKPRVIVRISDGGVKDE